MLGVGYPKHACSACWLSQIWFVLNAIDTDA